MKLIKKHLIIVNIQEKKTNICKKERIQTIRNTNRKVCDSYTNKGSRKKKEASKCESNSWLKNE